jgi:hypothetical protein
LPQCPGDEWVRRAPLGRTDRHRGLPRNIAELPAGVALLPAGVALLLPENRHVVAQRHVVDASGDEVAPLRDGWSGATSRWSRHAV